MRIFVIARPQIDQSSIQTFLKASDLAWRKTAGTHDPENIVEFAGRICYMSFGERQSPRKNEEYISNLLIQGHESVLEHVSWTFLLVGISRAFSHQLVRHRVGFSFSQLSQQYHDETDAEFVEPPLVRKVPKAFESWTRSMEVAKQSYRDTLAALKRAEPSLAKDISRKEANRLVRTIARSVLPNVTETKLVLTANARALRHFLELRGGIAGDLEMRSVSTELLKVLQKEAPALFSDFKAVRSNDGFTSVVRTRASSDA